MDITDDGIVNAPVKPVQASKADCAMEVTDEGIINEPVNPLQPIKAANPMEVIDDGIVNEQVKPLQLPKAKSPMEFIDAGITMDFRLVLPTLLVVQNAYCGISLAGYVLDPFVAVPVYAAIVTPLKSNTAS